MIAHAYHQGEQIAVYYSPRSGTLPSRHGSVGRVYTITAKAVTERITVECKFQIVFQCEFSNVK